MQSRFTQICFPPLDHDRFVIVLDKGKSDQFTWLHDADAMTAAAYCAIGASALFFLPQGSFAVMDVFRLKSETANPRFVFNYEVHNNRKKFDPAALIREALAKSKGATIPTAYLFGDSGEIKIEKLGNCILECPPGSGEMLVKIGCDSANEDAFCVCEGGGGEGGEGGCNIECRSSGPGT